VLIPTLVGVLVLSAVIGWVISDRSDGSMGNGNDSVTLDSAGTYDEPADSIPVAPDVKGDVLPNVKVEDLAGNAVTTGSLLGQPLVINLWFPTCVPCKKEMPDFAKVQQELGDQVRFVGISTQGTPNDIRSFADDRGVKYELLRDETLALPSKLSIGVYPATLFVTADGHIASLHQGAMTADTLRSTIDEELLG
jgi:thiol-disulfide isomerase/thioredoxin